VGKDDLLRVGACVASLRLFRVLKSRVARPPGGASASNTGRADGELEYMGAWVLAWVAVTKTHKDTDNSLSR
jgi:hypothetical protein